jgi:hypothetical protein
MRIVWALPRLVSMGGCCTVGYRTELADLPSLSAYKHASAHHGSHLRVVLGPLTAYLIVRIHELSMWVRSGGSDRIRRALI